MREDNTSLFYMEQIQHTHHEKGATPYERAFTIHTYYVNTDCIL